MLSLTTKAERSQRIQLNKVNSPVESDVESQKSEALFNRSTTAAAKSKNTPLQSGISISKSEAKSLSLYVG